MTTSSEPPCKKAKSVEWSITFDQVQSLQKLMEVISNVLLNVTMTIKLDDKRTPRIEIDSVDPKKVCMVMARLDASSSVNLGADISLPSFCVKSKALLTCLGSCPSHYSIDITKFPDSSDIILKSYETLSNSHVYEARIKTIVDDSEETYKLKNLTFKYVIEMDLHMLRGIVKSANSLSSEDIRFQVLEPKTTQTQRKITAFKLSAEGGDDATPANVFVSEVDADSNVIRTEENIQAEIDMEDMIVRYDHRFSTQYLNYFFKSMERQNLTMKLSEDRPLVIDYPLGKDGSYITFVLAARNESDY